MISFFKISSHILIFNGNNTMIKKFIFICLFLILITTVDYPQKYFWKNYTNTSQITYLMKDGDYMWIGTSGGLIKLNNISRDKIVYNKAIAGFPGNYITSVKKISNGNIWVGTKNGGLGKFDGQIWSSINAVNSALPVDYITSLSPGNNQDLWVATWGGGLVKKNNNSLTIYNIFNSVIPSNFITLIDFYSPGPAVNLALPYLDWFDFNGTEGSFFHNENYNFNISAIINDRQNYFWIANRNYLSGYFIPNMNEQYHFSFPVFDDYINILSEDSLNNIWLGTQNNGVFLWKDSSWTVYNKNNSGLPGNDVRAILNDGQIEWVGTFDGGLSKFNGTDWQSVNTNTSAPFQSSINTFFVDNEKNIWIGFCTDGIWKFNNGQWTNISSGNSGLSNNYIMSVAEDNNGDYWIGTYYGGLNKFDGTNWTNYNPSNSGLSDSNIVSVHTDLEDNIWVATWGGGLYRFNGVNWTVYNSSNSGLTDDYIFSMHIDKNDNIWLGTFGSGLFKFNGIQWQAFNTSNSDIPGNFISDIKSDIYNNVWIATWSDGLAEYNNDTFNTFNILNTSFPIDFINDIIVDDSNNIFIGTRNSGLVKLRINNSIFESGELYNKYNSGMIDNDVKALGKDNDGKIWIGFDDGIAVLYPDSVLSVDNRNTSETPADFILFQNYPNPFNPITIIEYTLPQSVMVTLKVYNILGEEVISLVNEEQLGGKHSVKFDGSSLPSGIYIYKLTAGNFSDAKKLVLMK